MFLGSRLSISMSTCNIVEGHHKDDYVGSRLFEVSLQKGIPPEASFICYSSMLHLKFTWISKNSFGLGFGQ